MNNIYIYEFKHKEKVLEVLKEISTTVIFCSGKTLNQSEIVKEIKDFYQSNYQTDKIVVIGGLYLKDQLIDIFSTKILDTFKYIPKREESYLRDNITIYTFDKNRSLTAIQGKASDKFKSKYINEGLQNIFLKRGGIVESAGLHHFVFPSGKHCNKFLRTGNILLISSEIYFIAFTLLNRFNEEIHSKIYCDTSSINVIAFTLIELKHRLKKSFKNDISVESFSSYDGIQNNSISYHKNSFFIISASTSGNIVEKLLKNNPIIENDNIVILFYLGESGNIRNNIICDLTISNKNQNGIKEFESYQKDNCALCKTGSYALSVFGDVFLLDSPKINKHIITVNDANPNLSKFVQQFKSVNRINTILKVNYKENTSTEAYEIFIDYSEIINGIRENKYPEYKQKINHYIDQYVPSNVRYIVNLRDQASKDLSMYIYDQINENYTHERKPQLIDQNSIDSINSESTGAVIVVGSCISNGKNLLYLSRALRKHENLRILYFIGLTRMQNEGSLNFLISNLSHGNYGKNTNSFHSIETMPCDNSSKFNSWLSEIEFLKELTLFVEDTYGNNALFKSFIEERKQIIYKSLSNTQRGLSNNLFYPRYKFQTNETEELILRKNFAFFNFDNYYQHVSQSDVYFTISNIINQLRSSNGSKQLIQSPYIRNLLDPANFDRFNDGIIQASILRCARPEELNYSLDLVASQAMSATLETLIRYNTQEQGEALLEFLYAIANKKMSLMKEHILKTFSSEKTTSLHPFYKMFTDYILANII
ncbi:hypothetical protein [Siphonobacter curvatus]|uniref:Uncharacterized protein n=1 Tax=Siphonobacter curvatus TaxID=2094562 RepID=A0A2S7IQ65_9BACT|nr:hypothetical protein [Siphonobacter curvatus]PQA59851.1 hypothetical protein C5O19_09575 [Siphonobacter curvatus]